MITSPCPAAYSAQPLTDVEIDEHMDGPRIWATLMERVPPVVHHTELDTAAEALRKAVTDFGESPTAANWTAVKEATQTIYGVKPHENH